MYKNLSAKYYQEINTDYKKLVKGFKNFLMKKKKKRDTMVKNVRKISQKMKNKSLLSIERNVMECEKMPNYN